MSECLDRLSRLRERLPEAELDGLVVSSPHNVFYLSGFRGSSGAALVTETRALLFSDFRYRLQAREQAPDFEFIEVPRRLLVGVGEAARADGLQRLGYDPAHLTCFLRDQLAEGAENPDLVPASDLVEDLRAAKSRAEIDRMAVAAALADAALDHMTSFLQPGATERDIALEGEFFMRRRGAEAIAFDLIVASGPRSALPHAETTDRALQPGDLVVIDMGARVDGYCSDMTRTYAVRTASEEARALYRIVYEAQRAAAAEVRAGARCGELDGRARAIIEEAGHGDHFGHGLGHGVGVEVHEAPRLAKDERTALAPGNVVTVEPGIYIEGMGGVRLEDMLVVTPGGADNLTGSPMPPELPVV
jgi:Xaa-Pro aminopeptidase